jgi:hypothetical protein
MHIHYSVVFLGFLAVPCAQAADWYVDGLHGVDGPFAGGAGGSTGACSAFAAPHGSRAAPFQTFGCAFNAAGPGDTIHLLPTTVYQGLLARMKGGTAGHPITIIGDGAGANPTMVTNNPAAGAGTPAATTALTLSGVSYVNVRNLDVSGDATASTACILVYDSNNIGIYGSNIHGCGQYGLDFSGDDYVTVSGNSVHDNSFNANNGVFGSGITFYEMRDIDKKMNIYKIKVFNNVIFHNYNTPRSTANAAIQKPPVGSDGICRIAINGSPDFPTRNAVPRADCCDPTVGEACCLLSPCYIYGYDSDGSGLILDTNVATGYVGASLIANNIVYNNGGRGLYAYLSGNLTAVDNTLYYNNQDPRGGGPRAGEVMLNKAYGAERFANNILYSDGTYSPRDPGDPHYTHVPFSCTGGTSGTLTYADNLAYNAGDDPVLRGVDQTLSLTGCAAAVAVSGGKWGDPDFVAVFANQSWDASADFRLSPASAALGLGSPPGTYVATDITGAARVAPIAAGAY